MNSLENFNKPIHSRLGKMLSHGGSSLVYELDQNHVVKEKLSRYIKDALPADITGDVLMQSIHEQEKQIQKEDKNMLFNELQENKERILNNLRICEQYLGNFLLKTQLLLEQNKNAIPTIYIIQEKVPKKAKFLGSTRGFKMDDKSMNDLNQMIHSIETMYTETGLMVDLLSLDNVAYSEADKKFYLYDIDPLICDEKNYVSFRDKYEVDFEITNDFETVSNQKTRNAIDACLDHLEHLKLFLKTD